MKFTRRQWLQSMAGIGALGYTGGLGGLLQAASSAPTVTDRYFVFAYFSGGWDGLLALDPRDPDVFTPDQVTSSGIETGYDLQDVEEYLVPTAVDGMTFGPYIGNLANHADRLAVLRGMAMSAVAHDPARKHALTGYMPAGTSARRSSVATLLASLLGENEPIPNLTVGVDSFNLGHPLWSSGLPAGSIEDLYKALTPVEVDLLSSQRDALEHFFEKQSARAQTSLEASIYGNRIIARSLIDQDLAELFNIDSTDSAMSGLRSHYGIDSGEGGEGGKMALLASQALTQGVSRCVSIRVSNDLDSHQGFAWQNEHGPNLAEGFNAIAALADDLSSRPFGDTGDSWLDHTTIACFSEFGRGPLLNNAEGRDHSLINAMLLLGGGIQGGQVIGASSDTGMQAQAVDLETGQLSEGGELLSYDHVARSLLASIGVTDDIGDFRVEPISSMLTEAS
jgi:hypothetical protein